MQRPDADHEVLRRTNALARIQPKEVLFAGVGEAAFKQLAARLPMAAEPDVDEVRADSEPGPAFGPQADQLRNALKGR